MVPDQYRNDVISLSIARIILAGTLLGYSVYFENHDGISDINTQLLANAYLFSSALLYFLTRYSKALIGYLALGPVVLDGVFIAGLMIFGSGFGPSIAILFFLPLVGVALLHTQLQVLAVSSSATLFILTVALRDALAKEDVAIVGAAGMYGVSFLVIPLLLNKLAERLRAQQLLTLESARRLELQTKVSSHVMERMADGVVVVNSKKQVCSVNSAALDLLKVLSIRSLDLSDLDGSNHLLDFKDKIDQLLIDVSLRKNDSRRSWTEIGPVNDIRFPGADRQTSVEIVLESLIQDSMGTPMYVFFLKDVGAIEERAQHLKLASMGRLTASIAHEIRNPLAAIAHANEILSEETRSHGDRRLLEIIGTNAKRVNKMVEDILALSRKRSRNISQSDLHMIIDDVVSEICSKHKVRSDVFLIEVRQEMVLFEHENLRAVVFNLVENATRFCSMKSQSILLRTYGDRNGSHLFVANDGPQISSEERLQIFEPFYSTHSKGTGLGLFLAREFCLSNSAKLEYRSMPVHSGELQIGFGFGFAISFQSSHSKN